MVNRSGYNPRSHRYAPFRVPYRSAYNGMDLRRGDPAFSQNYDQHSVMRGGNGDAPPEGTTTRKRIAVACGRCRKRKIRCSGDNGNGERCASCTAARASPCQFLRVSSLEANLKENPRGFQAFSLNTESSRSYQPTVEEEAMTGPPPTSQALAAFSPMYHETMNPAWGQVPYDMTQYKTAAPFSGGNVSFDRTVSWNSGGYYGTALDHSGSPNATHYGSMFAQAQDPRYQMAHTKPLPYLDTDSCAYTFAGQTTAIPTTATLVSRSGVADTGSNVQMHDLPHGLMLQSPAMDKFPVMESSNPQTPDQIVGTKMEPFGSTGTYSKPNSSPASSFCMTPSSSYGSYAASAALAYPATVTVKQQTSQTFPSMDNCNELANVGASLPSQFPYTDMGAEASAMVVSTQRLSLMEESAQLTQFQAQQNCFAAGGLSQIERKPPTMPY